MITSQDTSDSKSVWLQLRSIAQVVYKNILQLSQKSHDFASLLHKTKAQRESIIVGFFSFPKMSNLTEKDVEKFFSPQSWQETARKLGYNEEEVKIISRLDSQVTYPYYIEGGPLDGTKKYIDGPAFRNIGDLARFELDSVFSKDEKERPIKKHFKDKKNLIVAPEFMESYFAQTKNTNPDVIPAIPLSIEGQDEESDDKVVIDLFLRSYNKAAKDETE